MVRTGLLDVGVLKGWPLLMLVPDSVFHVFLMFKKDGDTPGLGGHCRRGSTWSQGSFPVLLGCQKNLHLHDPSVVGVAHRCFVTSNCG